MNTPILLASATKLMGEPVSEIIPMKHQPRWAALVVIPIVAAAALSAPLWMFAVAGGVAGVLMTLVTETRFLAFTAGRIGVLRGNQWLPARLKAVERDVSPGDIQPLGESLLSRKFRLAGKEYTTTKKLADRLFVALSQHPI